jgi:hypothetical protein
MSGIFSLAGTKVSIGTTATVDFTSDSAATTDFEADTYVKIAKTETLSDFGDEASDVSFTGMEDSRTIHIKGSTDGGMPEITCAEVSDDPGQQAVKAAAGPGVKDEYNFKFEWPNGDVGYLRGQVFSWSRVNGSGPNNVMKRSFKIGNNYGELLVLAS